MVRFRPIGLSTRSPFGPISLVVAQKRPAHQRQMETTVITDPTMRLLADHVPVTLLMDLMAPPNSHEVFDLEGGEADWLSALNRSAA